jgi:hypothetical protein
LSAQTEAEIDALVARQERRLAAMGVPS